jgi:hypothetical protein
MAPQQFPWYPGTGAVAGAIEQTPLSWDRSTDALFRLIGLKQDYNAA